MPEEENKKEKEPEKTPLEQAGEDLFNYASDREDIRYLMEHLPGEADISRVTVEYELQVLKIVAVGWSISYFLAESAYKTPLLSLYWESIREYAGSLSSTAGLLTGQDIDYFQVLKDRLDKYVAALARNPEAPEPATVVGPEFAELCGNRTDIFTHMTGAKLFLSTLSRIRAYLAEMPF
jgi:hypothetical protein